MSINVDKELNYKSILYKENNCSKLLEFKNKINPLANTSKIIFYYLVISFFWILISDYLIYSLNLDNEIIKMIQMYKGWIFILVTSIVFFLIIYRRLKLQTVLIDELYRLAYYDSLTQFPNKYYLDKKMKSIIDEGNNQGKKVGLAYLDIDDFKNINETMGHCAGDNLLKIIANKIDKALSPPDFFGRIGGDEFVIIYHDANLKKIIESIEGLIKDISKPWFYNKHTFISSISAGIAIYPDHAKDYANLFQNADVALSDVKENGKKGYSFFTEAMKEKAWHYIEMDNKIRLALERKEFQLYYQPQIDIKSGEIIGVESLIRWEHPEDGFIAPGDFIPFAEKFGYINKISAWVFNKACKQKQDWLSKGYKPIKTSINLSGDTLTMKNLVSRIRESLKKYEIEDQGIEIEITETSLINDVKGSIEILKELKNLNMSIALDDFGTGYSSLNYLKKLPIDILKIDRIFISDIGKSEKEDIILIYIIELAHRLNIKVMAEGVETQEQLYFLLKNNCDYAQGYYFYKPMPANEFEKLLTRE